MLVLIWNSASLHSSISLIGSELTAAGWRISNCVVFIRSLVLGLTGLKIWKFLLGSQQDSSLDLVEA